MSPCSPAVHSAQASEQPVYLIEELCSIYSSRTGQIVSQDFFTCPVSEPGDCFTPELLLLLRRYGSCSLSGRFCHLFLLANTLIWHTVIAHCYSNKIARSHTRADKQDGNSNDNHIFSPTHFHSIKRPIPRILSVLIMMALTRIYAPSLLLCLFILAHCLDPHHVDNKTVIDQYVLACGHTFNVYSSTPHLLSWC